MNSTLTVSIHINVLLANPKFLSKPCNQIASLTTSVNAMYSASVVESPTIDCSVDFQLIGPQAKVNTYSVVDRHLSKLPA